MVSRKLASQSARATNKRWNEAIDWLLNSRHTADPDIQGPFWAYVDGWISLDELDKFSISSVEERKAELGIED
jgi:hypothetical protein